MFVEDVYITRQLALLISKISGSVCRLECKHARNHVFHMSDLDRSIYTQKSTEKTSHYESSSW